MKNWNLLFDNKVSSINQLKEVLLKNRNISNSDLFFKPIHPYDLKLLDVKLDVAQVKRAVIRIKEAVKQKQKIVIFGDYDADGICATAIIWKKLKSLKITAIPFIPDRQKHGYGLTKDAISDLLTQHQPDLIITVDNGITSANEIELLKQNNIDVIITDHHQIPDQIPQATAVVHSTEICGAAVAYMLTKQLSKQPRDQYLDLVAIATVADVMPLKDTNRSFVKYGLNKLKKTSNPGLKQIISLANINPNDLKAYHIGFMIAPRINAAGRIGDPLESLRLLCTEDEKAVKFLADNLEQLNQKRKKMTQDLMNSVLRMRSKFNDQNIIIINSEQFHEGIVGLLAGKLTDYFNKPSMVMKQDYNIAKGSARSVKGIDITKLLKKFEKDFLSLGGHEQAAGYSIESTKIVELINKIQDYANNNINKDLLKRSYNIDSLLAFKIIDLDLVNMIEEFAPFGVGNPKPTFLLKEVNVVERMKFGYDKKHNKIFLSQNHINKKIEAISWFRQIGPQIDDFNGGDIIGKLSINEWKSIKKVQFTIKDFYSSE